MLTTVLKLTRCHPPSKPAHGHQLSKLTNKCFVCVLQLDEGDKLLEAGEDTFLTQVDSIISACGPSLSEKLKKSKKKKGKKGKKKGKEEEEGASRVQRCLFSATLPPQVEELARSFLIDPLRITVGQRSVSSNPSWY